jgi:SPP1 family predicted phage head-tail adaptor
VKDVGKLNKRVTLQRLVNTRGTSGELVESWQDEATVWAAVEPLSGREYWQAQEMASETSIRVRIRYRAGLVPTMRVVYGARHFEILSIIDLEEGHREMQLMCRELREGVPA